jgi:hypothetical protein
MPSSPLALLFTVALAMTLPACSSSSSVADGGADAGAVPFSCGSTVDCQAVGLDADTCVYKAVANGCSQVGQCQDLAAPTDPAGCAPSQTACPCSGGTQTIPACYQGFSPFAVLALGPCPADGGP